MNMTCNLHINIGKIFNKKTFPLNNHLTFIAVQHNLFITEITQTSIIFYTDFFGSIYRTDKRTLPFQHKITPCIFYIPMRKKKKIELLICRFGVDEKRKTTLSHLLCSRIWDRVVFLFSDYSKSTVGENGDSPEGYGSSGN